MIKLIYLALFASISNKDIIFLVCYCCSCIIIWAFWTCCCCQLFASCISCSIFLCWVWMADCWVPNASCLFSSPCCLCLKANSYSLNTLSLSVFWYKKKPSKVSLPFLLFFLWPGCSPSSTLSLLAFPWLSSSYSPPFVCLFPFVFAASLACCYFCSLL